MYEPTTPTADSVRAAVHTLMGAISREQAETSRIRAELADLHAVAADAIAERDSLANQLAAVEAADDRSLGEQLKAQTCGFEAAPEAV